MTKNFLTYLLFGLTLLSARQVMAATTQAATTVSHILVKVNSKGLITTQDLKRRAALVAATTGQNLSAFTPSIMKELLQSLIDEALQLDAAEQAKITIAESAIKQAVQNIAKENGMSLNMFLQTLKARGVSARALEDRFRAHLAWMHYIRQTYAPLVRVSDRMIDMEVERIHKEENKTQYLLSEIFLPANSPAEATNAQNTARQILQQLKGGANFYGLAQQYSKASSAEKGGQLDWRAPSQMEGSWLTALQKTTVGQCTELIRSEKGYHLLLVREMRTRGQSSPDQVKVSYYTLVVPFSPNMPPQQQEAIVRQVEVLAGAKNPQEFSQIAKKMGANLTPSSEVGFNQLPAELQHLFTKQMVGKCPRPLRVDKGILVGMLLSRKEEAFQPPSRDDIRLALEQKQLTDYAVRDMLNRRSKASIVESGKEQEGKRLA